MTQSSTGYGRGPEQLTSLSIEQIEAQLQRTREAAAGTTRPACYAQVGFHEPVGAIEGMLTPSPPPHPSAAGNMQAQQQMMQPQQQPQQQQFYSVVPQIVKTSPMYPQFQQG